MGGAPGKSSSGLRVGSYYRVGSLGLSFSTFCKIFHTFLTFLWGREIKKQRKKDATHSGEGDCGLSNCTVIKRGGDCAIRGFGGVFLSSRKTRCNFCNQKSGCDSCIEAVYDLIRDSTSSTNRKKMSKYNVKRQFVSLCGCVSKRNLRNRGLRQVVNQRRAATLTAGTPVKCVD